jgi:hypothetical protein
MKRNEQSNVRNQLVTNLQCGDAGPGAFAVAIYEIAEPLG